jgi:hypothetical protein
LVDRRKAKLPRVEIIENKWPDANLRSELPYEVILLEDIREAGGEVERTLALVETYENAATFKRIAEDRLRGKWDWKGK